MDTNIEFSKDTIEVWEDENGDLHEIIYTEEEIIENEKDDEFFQKFSELEKEIS